MGEMADMYADQAMLAEAWMEDGYPTGYGPDNRFDDFREDIWQTKDGKQFTIKQMTDKHLLAAFKMFGDDRFRDEMLIRIFERNMGPKVVL